MFDFQSARVGDTVPAVMPEDLRAVLDLMAEVNKLDSKAGPVSIGADYLRGVCSPDAEVGTVWFRAALLRIALEQGQFTNVQSSEAFLKLWATFPFRVIEQDKQGNVQLNFDELEAPIRDLGLEI